jgi:hypothetical protein
MPFFASAPESGLISPILMVWAELVSPGKTRSHKQKMMPKYLTADNKTFRRFFKKFFMTGIANTVLTGTFQNYKINGYVIQSP